MKVLVIGGTGTVGSAVVAELRARGHEPYVMTRSADKARQLREGTAHVVADLGTPATLPAAFRGMDAAFLLAPVGPAASRASPDPRPRARCPREAGAPCLSSAS